MFITWTQNGGQLTGDLEQAILQGGGDAGQESVNTDSIAFTGTMSGSSVTLTLNQGLGSTNNLTGTLSGDTLALNYPGENGSVITLELQPGTASAYNRRLAALQALASGANNAAKQVADAQQQASNAQRAAAAVTNDIATLHSDANQLATTDFYSQGLADETKEVGQTQTDMNAVLNEGSGAQTVCSDSGVVDSDVGTVQSDVGAIQSDQGASESSATTVSDDLAQLAQDAQALAADRSSNPADVPASAPTQADISNAIAAADSALTTAKQNATSALAKANAAEAIAAGYQKRADAVCNAGGGA